MKRSRRKKSMSSKIHGGSWLDGWGKNKRVVRRQERRIREREARRNEEQA